MKFSRLDSMTLAEKGVEMEVPDPISGAPSGAFLTLCGADSKVCVQAQEELLSYNKAHGKNSLSEDDWKEVYARCTIGWRGWENEDGTEAKFSQDAVREKYKALPYLVLFAGASIGNRRNYFPKP